MCLIRIGVGKIKVISISKIKNINLIEKKCTENLIRGLEKGSNPHSKGEDFSRSNFLWILIIGIINKIVIKIREINEMKIITDMIILS